MMFEGGNQHFVAGADVCPAEGLGDKVDALGGATDEDDLAGPISIQETANCFPGRFVVVGGALGKGVHAAMNVGIVALVIVANRIDHGAGLLRSGSVVQIDERLAVDQLMQDREFLADVLNVERAARSGNRRGRGNTLSGSGHRTSSSEGTASPADAEARREGWRIREICSWMSFSMRSRTPSSFMRSRHSLAKARSRRRRADCSSMPRDLR